MTFELSIVFGLFIAPVIVAFVWACLDDPDREGRQARKRREQRRTGRYH